MFYINFVQACTYKHVAPTTLLRKLKMSTGNIERWKRGVQPNTATIQKIAGYLEVTVESLLYDSNGKKKDTNNLAKDNFHESNNAPEIEEDKELIELMKNIRKLTRKARQRVIDSVNDMICNPENIEEKQVVEKRA